MKTIVYNKHNLKETDMTEVVKRVKLLLVNSNKELLLGYSHNDYQFPGGHVEEDEDLMLAISREIKEETGIDLEVRDLQPFAAVYGYYKDWPKKDENRKIEIYYYEVKTDAKPKLDEINLTDSEKEGNFEVRYVHLDNIEKELLNNIDKYTDKHGITKEMLEVIKFYKENN